MKNKKIIAGLILSATLLTANTSTFAAKESYEKGIFYDENEKPANWWYDDGDDWFFFKDGKKLTGVGKDNNGEHLFEKGKYVKGYKDNKFYDDGKLANWWYDDGNDWYYFKDGEKLTGEGTDANGSHYFVNGKYGQKENKENKTTNSYVNGIFYDENKKPANWWYDDGTNWFFFKDGKKLTGEGTDANGSHYFVNGKYANGDFKNAFYENGKVKYYKNGKYKNTLVYKNHVIKIGAFAGSDEVKAYASRRKDKNDVKAYADAGHVLVQYHPLDLTDGKGSALLAHAGMNFRPLWENLKNGEIITVYDIHGNYANFKMKLDVTILNDKNHTIVGKDPLYCYYLAQKEENIQVGFCRTMEYQERWLGEICN